MSLIGTLGVVEQIRHDIRISQVIGAPRANAVVAFEFGRELASLTGAQYSYAAGNPLDAADPTGLAGQSLNSVLPPLPGDYIPWPRLFQLEMAGCLTDAEYEYHLGQVWQAQDNLAAFIAANARDKAAASWSVSSVARDLDYAVSHPDPTLQTLAEVGYGCVAGAAAVEGATGGGGAAIPGIGYVTSGAVAAVGCVLGGGAAYNGLSRHSNSDRSTPPGRHRAG